VSAALLAIGLMPGLSGCATHFLRSHAERRIGHKLVDLIGPADEYKVRILGTRDADIVAGRVRCIEIDGWNVRAGHQIELESLHLELHELHYHPAPDETVSVGESHLVIQLTQEALNEYLRRQEPDHPTDVTLNAGSVTLKGSMDLLGVPTPLVTSGRLEIVEHTRLDFRADTVQLSGDPIPGIGAAYVESHLNPLLNIKRLHVPLRLDEVETQPGRLVVRGSISLPPAPRRPR
jgi:LmeA-like phospholipid-binding